MSAAGLPVAILAGGKATRLGDIAAAKPKALMEVAGHPFVFHQLRQLREHGLTNIVMCVGHLGSQVEAAVGDGSAHGVSISYSADPPGLAGTAGALRAAGSLLGDAFLVLYGDTYLSVDFADVARVFEESDRLGLLTVLRNEGRWGESNTAVEDGRVARHDKRKPVAGMEWIDYGLGALRAAALAHAPAATDLSDVYAELAAKGELLAYPVTERFHEIGTPEALAETDAFLRGI
jgi:NDP-sugar pyrophosphorylase family protein